MRTRYSYLSSIQFSPSAKTSPSTNARDQRECIPGVPEEEREQGGEEKGKREEAGKKVEYHVLLVTFSA